MELQLKRNQINCFESVLHTTVQQEETAEMIVPDACPDILRIADTEGIACIRNKEAKTGVAQIDGFVKTTVLYVPEGTVGLQRLPLQIPFSCKIEHAGIVPQMVLSVHPTVASAETRMMNPRKILVKVEVCLYVEGYVPDTIELCTEVEADPTASLQTLQKEQTIWMVTGVGEKPFQFSDQMNLPSGKPEVEEILKYRLFPSCDDAKMIGTKLIFKGEVVIRIFYRSVAGSLQTVEYTLPYSQMMEMKGVEENASCSVSVVSADVSIGVESDGEGSSFEFSMGFLAQAQAWEERHITLLSDLYSTSCLAVPQVQNYFFHGLREVGENRKSNRETVETTVLPKSVLDAYVMTGAVAQMQEEENKVFSTETKVMVLYLGEDNQIYEASMRVPVEERIIMEETKTCICRISCPGEVFATPTPSGLEVRYPIDFSFQILTDLRMSGIIDVTIEEGEEIKRPSMVVRMTEAGDQIWDLAKQYASTMEDICAANALEDHDAELPVGRLILIPHKR
ncbi:MAG: DUF3794 and LysM peptidoglycan-binding domain-containing protein [Oscillospiraceae bacterium]|jgi:hypothetical protein